MPIIDMPTLGFGSQAQWTIPGTPAFANVMAQRAAAGAGGYAAPSFSYGGGGGGGNVATSNLQSAGNVAGLANIINSINLGAQKAALAARIPQAPALEAKSSELIAQELGGEIPADVQRMISQRAAEIGAGRGLGVSAPVTNANYLQLLGRTSLEQQQAGEQNLTGALARNPPAPIYDPSQQFLTAGQAGQLGIESQRLALQAQEMQQRGALESARMAQESGAAARLRGGPVTSTTTPGWQPDQVYYSSTYGQPTEPDLLSMATTPTERWLESIGYGSTRTGSTSATGTTNVVPPGAELDPNLGLYVDPSTMQAYSSDTGAPVSLDEFFGG